MKKKILYSKKLKKLFDFSYKAYQEKNVTGQEYRQLYKIPYLVHPFFCAAMLIADQRLPDEKRKLGFQALILHDVLEDTSAKLPRWVNPKVKKLVKEMTFEDWEKKKKEVGKKSKFVKLLLLVDGIANMYEETPNPKKWKDYKKQVQYLLKEVRKDYPKSRIVQMGKMIIENTNW